MTNDAPRSLFFVRVIHASNNHYHRRCYDCDFFWRMGDFSPLSNGKVPADKKSPTEHWKFMRDNLAFVREMTEPLHTKTKATLKKS